MVADGLITVKGPFSDINLDIKAMTRHGTNLTIPLNQTATVKDNDFIIFLSKEVEEVEDWTDLCYEDLSSPSQERYLKLVKEQLELLFTEEFQRIKDKTNESEEIKRIRRENEELKRRLAMVDMDFVEDMGK